MPAFVANFPYPHKLQRYPPASSPVSVWIFFDVLSPPLMSSDGSSHLMSFLMLRFLFVLRGTCVGGLYIEMTSVSASICAIFVRFLARRPECTPRARGMLARSRTVG